MDDKLHRLRHSAAHIMAQAVQELFPGTKLAIGPATETGFYYDFDSKTPFQPEDLVRIEKRMQEIVKEDHPFTEHQHDRAEIKKLFEKRQEKYKLEIIDGIDAKDPITTYEHGPFVDLCRGPHLKSTGELKAFKLMSVAGAYWKGSESNPMLQRIYGTAFATPKELRAFLKVREEAQRRDHRRLGKELGLFSFHAEGPGFPFWHPKGLTLYETLLGYWKKVHARAGYEQIRTPIILSEELWRKSGHYDHYKEHMYFTHIDEHEYAVKPMNCPGGLLIYKGSQHSYRDLPIRMAELGLVHRHELSGVLHGLFRVKSFVIDDAHIYCALDGMQDEISSVLKLILDVYDTVGFEKVSVELSTRPDHSMGSDDTWNQATSALEGALKKLKIKYRIQPGEGAFYGPKIDFHVHDCLGRTWQCGTIQVDFSMPERFSLEYTAQDGKKHRPVMIHRACFGSVERFLGILIEHYAGAFPVWLAPVQVEVLSISDKHADYARRIVTEFQKADIRAKADIRPEKIGYKIRQVEKQKVPYALVVGDEESGNQTVRVRRRGGKDLGAQKIHDFILSVQQEINEKRR